MKKQELFNNVTEGFPYQRQPQQVGLYDAAYEHDACGVGMLVNIHGEKSHDIVESALKVLENMHTAKNNALYKEGLIQQAFPELETYVTFTSPFWRLRVGDFRSYEEAGNALIQLKKEFPQMAREMRVVRDKIHIQIHQGFTE